MPYRQAWYSPGDWIESVTLKKIIIIVVVVLVLLSGVLVYSFLMFRATSQTVKYVHGIDE